MTDEWISAHDAVELLRSDMERKARVDFADEPPPSQLRRWRQEHVEAARVLIWKQWRNERLLLRSSTIRSKTLDADEPSIRSKEEITYEDWQGPLNGGGLAIGLNPPAPDVWVASSRFTQECTTWEWSGDGALTITKDRIRLSNLPNSELAGFTEATGIEVCLQDLRQAFGLATSPAGNDSQLSVGGKLSQAAVDAAAQRFADGKLAEKEVKNLAISSLGAEPIRDQWRKAWSKVPTDRKLRRGRKPA